MTKVYCTSENCPHHYNQYDCKIGTITLEDGKCKTYSNNTDITPILKLSEFPSEESEAGKMNPRYFDGLGEILAEGETKETSQE
tara:strand:- start:283 stop:534 length:252 start_codon:yes stop_codon:yes gene_type:complete